MIIQNSNTNQASSPARLVSDDAPKAVLPRVISYAPESAAAQKPSAHQLNNAIDTVNYAMRQSNQSLQFSVDASTKKPIIKMVDISTGELVRQIPSKEMLAIAQSIDDFMQRQGLLFNQKA